MIGQIIESRRPFPWGAFVFALLAAALLAVAVLLHNGHWAVGACLPLFVALALALRRQRSLGFEFTETGLEVFDPRQSIPYESMESVIAPARPGDPDKPGPRHYAIDLVHEGGTLHI